MSNKYLEKIAAMSESELNNALDRQAAMNAIRTDLLGPIGSAFNYMYSPSTLEDIRRKTGTPDTRRPGDWSVPAFTGLVGAGVGGALGDALHKAIRRRYMVGPRTAVALSLLPAVGSAAGAIRGGREGMKLQLSDSLEKIRENEQIPE